jgi:hypothetical protein
MAMSRRWICLAVALCGSLPADAGTTATLTLTASASAAVAPASVKLTAVVSGASLSGSIAFNDGAAPIGSAPIKGGKAVLAATLGVGIHRISAAYIGGGKAIASPTVSVVVDNAPLCN